MHEHARVVAVVVLVVLAAVAAPVSGLGASAGDRPSSTQSGPAHDPGDAQGGVDPALENATGTETVVVRFEPASAAPALPAQAEAALRDHAARTQGPFNRFADGEPGVTVREEFWLANAMVVDVDTDAVPLEELLRNPNVVRVHENVEVNLTSAASASTSSDASGASATTAGASSSPSASATASESYTYGLEMVGAPTVWNDYDQRGQNATVAVLDTGVDPTHHPDLVPDGWAEFDDDGEQLDTDPNDGNGHGTHVSGTVVGETMDDDTHYGVAPEATHLHGKVLQDDGSGTFAAVVSGMEWSVEQGADVVSMSLSATGYYSTFIEPVENARASGAVVIASIGNEGENTSGSPANVYDAVSVGAVNESEGVAAFSGGEEIDTDDAWGGDAPSHWPDTYLSPSVSAPGVSTYSADDGGGYTAKSGTSMAAPHVAGVLTLVRSEHRHLGVAGVEGLLVDTATHPDGDVIDHRYGTGIVDAADAITAVSSVEGTVAAAFDGRAVAGANVTISKDGEAVANLTADETGHFSVPLSPGETYTVAANGSTYQRAATNVTVEEDEPTTVDLELPLDPGYVGGVVNDAAVDEPAPAVAVDVLDGGTLLNHTETLATGGFLVGPHENGTYEVAVNDSAFEPANATVEVTDDAEAVVELAAEPLPGTVSWTARSDVTGDVLSGGNATLLNASGAVVNATSLAGNHTGTFDPVPRDRDYELAIEHVDYEDDSVGFEVAPNGTVDRDVHLEPLPATVAGTVTTADGGDSIDGATVEVNGTDVSPATTDENGTYRLGGVPAEREHDVVVDARAHDANESLTVAPAANGSQTLNATLSQRARYFGVEPVDGPDAVDEGETASFGASILNLGTDDWNDTVSFAVDGTEVATRDVPLNATNGTSVTFDRTFDDEGTYEVAIATANETKTRELSVESTGGGSLPAPPQSDDEPPADEGEPSIAVTGASLDSSTVDVGESVAVTATVRNDGDAAGSIDLTLTADGGTVDTATQAVPAGAERTATLSTSFEEPGQYDLVVNGVEAGTVQVGVSADEEPTEEQPADGTPGFGVGAALVALLAALGALARRPRRRKL